jgi:ribosomal protein L37E
MPAGRLPDIEPPLNGVDQVVYCRKCDDITDHVFTELGKQASRDRLRCLVCGRNSYAVFRADPSALGLPWFPPGMGPRSKEYAEHNFRSKA